VDVEGFEGGDDAMAVVGEVCEEALAVGEAEHDVGLSWVLEVRENSRK